MQLDASDLLLQSAYAWERRQPNAVFMTQPVPGGGVREYTWKQTLDEARRMAAHLKSLGLGPGDQVAIMSKNCAHFVLSDLAIWMAGCVSVALYPTLTADTVAYILEHSEAKLLFVGKLDTWEEMKPGVPEGLRCIRYPSSPPETAHMPDWTDIVQATQPIPDSPVREANDMAILVYTSGSTGKPKGVAHSFEGMSAPSRGLRDVFQVTPKDRFISYLPLAHVFERAVVEASGLIHGHQIFFADALDTFVQDIQRARPTIFHSVPRLWLKFQQGVLAKMPQEKLDKVLRIPILSRLVKKQILKGLGLDKARIAVSGSAPIPAELITWYQKLGLELLEGYGMSENFAYSHSSEEGASRPGYVGSAMPDVEVRLSDEGEVLVKSPANMLGYFKQPELTKESFTEDGFLKTGDRGEIDAQGRLRITGRTKELFKTSKGKYVAPAPIENMLNAHPLVEQCCVSGNGYPAPLAVLLLSEELRKKGEMDRAAIGAQLEKLLAEVNRKVEPFERLEFLAVVAEDWQIENGFLTPTMKIKRNIIEDAYKGMYDGWYAGKAPVVWAEPSTAVVSLIGKTVRPEGTAAAEVAGKVMGQGRPTAGR